MSPERLCCILIANQLNFDRLRDIGIIVEILKSELQSEILAASKCMLRTLIGGLNDSETHI